MISRPFKLIWWSVASHILLGAFSCQSFLLIKEENTSLHKYSNYFLFKFHFSPSYWLKHWSFNLVGQPSLYYIGSFEPPQLAMNPLFFISSSYSTKHWCYLREPTFEPISWFIWITFNRKYISPLIEARIIVSWSFLSYPNSYSLSILSRPSKMAASKSTHFVAQW